MNDMRITAEPRRDIIHFGSRSIALAACSHFCHDMLQSETGRCRVCADFANRCDVCCKSN